MKKLIIATVLLMFAAVTFCQNSSNMEKEKEAIKAVIEEETNAFKDRDLDRVKATYLMDETTTRLNTTSGFNLMEGWETLGSGFSEFLKDNPEPVKNTEVKSNYRIKLYNDCAWVIFDEEVPNVESGSMDKVLGLNLLEKVEGNWKIVFLGRIPIEE